MPAAGLSFPSGHAVLVAAVACVVMPVLPGGWDLVPVLLTVLVMVGLYLFLTRTYIGTAIRAVSQDRGAMSLMGASPQRIYTVTSAVGGAIPGMNGAAGGQIGG